MDENYTTELRKKIGDILSEALDGRVSEFTPFFGEGALVRIHFVIAANSESIADFEIDIIKERIRQIVRGWSNELKEALIHDSGEAEGRPYLVMRYLDAGTLKDRMTQGPLSLGEINRIIEPVTSLHARGTVQNDYRMPAADPFTLFDERRGDSDNQGD